MQDKFYYKNEKKSIEWTTAQKMKFIETMKYINSNFNQHYSSLFNKSII